MKTTYILVGLATLSAACARKNTNAMELTADDTSLPVACRPGALSKDDRERSRILRESVSKSITRKTELPSGYSFRLPADPGVFRRAAEWITLERRCCPFLTFDLRWGPGDDTPPSLAIMGPTGTKDFLAAEMPELPVEGQR